MPICERELVCEREPVCKGEPICEIVTILVLDLSTYTEFYGKISIRKPLPEVSLGFKSKLLLPVHKEHFHQKLF